MKNYTYGRAESVALGALSGNREEGRLVRPWALQSRLSVLILIEFVVFGAWFSTLGLVLATHGLAPYIANAYFISAVAAMASPLLIGAIADRFFSAQKVMAFLHLAGGLVLFCIPHFVATGNGNAVVGLIFVYMLFFMPTLGLVISIPLYHLSDRPHFFPYVRVFSPFGWFLGGMMVGLLGLSASTGTFVFAGVASMVMAAYALSLPNTPPALKNAKFDLGDLFAAKAFVLFKQRNFVVLMICTLLTSISLGVYNAFASPYLGALGIKNVSSVLAIGQLSEVVFVLTIPYVLSKIGMKWAILAGMAMWGVRFLLFIAAAPDHVAYAVAGVALHGICNDFFLIVAALYIDRVAPPALKAQAQGLLILVLSGLGGAVGAKLGGFVFVTRIIPHMTMGASAWEPLWLLPISTAVITVVIWTVFFRYSLKQEKASAAVQ